VIIVCEESAGSAITRCISRSSSSLNSTTLAMSEYTVSSVGATRDDWGRLAGAGIARRAETEVWTGVKLTLPASGSERVFTGQRSVPQWTPAVGGAGVSRAGVTDTVAGAAGIGELKAELGAWAVAVVAEDGESLLHPMRTGTIRIERAASAARELGMADDLHPECCRYFIPTPVLLSLKPAQVDGCYGE